MFFRWFAFVCSHLALEVAFIWLQEHQVPDPTLLSPPPSAPHEASSDLLRDPLIGYDERMLTCLAA